jgi:hypothetical protein
LFVYSLDKPIRTVYIVDMELLPTTPTTKETHMSAIPTTYTEIGFPLVALSTGRIIAVGIYSYASEVNADGTQKDRSEHTRMSDIEVDEAWELVNARCRAKRLAK